MNIKFDSEKVQACLDEIQNSVSQLSEAVEAYSAHAKSLEGSSEEWIGPVDGNLQALKRSYQESVVPATKPLTDWVAEVEQAYAGALSKVQNNAPTGGTGNTRFTRSNETIM